MYGILKSEKDQYVRFDDKGIQPNASTLACTFLVVMDLLISKLEDIDTRLNNLEEK